MQLKDGRILLTEIAEQNDLQRFISICGAACNDLTIKILPPSNQDIAVVIDADTSDHDTSASSHQQPTIPTTIDITQPQAITPLSTDTLQPTPTIPIPTDTPQPPPTPTIKNTARVLWDTAHGPRYGETGSYAPDDVYSGLRSYLSAQNITLLEGSVNQDLSGIDAIVIAVYSFWDGSLDYEEAARIQQFVESGGGLVLLGDVQEAPNRLGNLTDLLGIRISQKPELGGVTSFSNHPITEGINQLNFYRGGSLDIGKSSFETVGGSSGAPAVAVATVGQGRVVVIGDCNIFDNRWFSGADNQLFAKNVFLWVTFILD
jgi:hypothetical protein